MKCCNIYDLLIYIYICIYLVTTKTATVKWPKLNAFWNMMLLDMNEQFMSFSQL